MVAVTVLWVAALAAAAPRIQPQPPGGSLYGDPKLLGGTAPPPDVDSSDALVHQPDT
ncbi:hypothetical protein E4U41_004039, partial [Claviceps citrina]